MNASEAPDPYRPDGSSPPLVHRRILILVQNLPVPFDRRVWQEAKTLTSAGADVTVVCPSDDSHPVGDFSIDGVRVIRYLNPPEARGVLGYVREYWHSIRRMTAAAYRARIEGPFDAVHFCNPPDLLFLVARRFKASDSSVLVFDQHDLGPELVDAKQLPLAPFFRAITGFLERWTYRTADHVVSTNESYKAIAMRRGKFTPDRITVVRSGPDRAWSLDPVASTDWHNGRRYLIGYLGVMGRQEGIEQLIQAVKILVEQGLDVCLSLIGSGPDRARLESLVASAALSDRVTFHGRVPDTQLREILSDADVCVNPDEVNQMNDLSTMNKIIEYMALARPIVQFDVKEGRFSARDASLYASADSVPDFAAKIREVLEDPRLGASMGEFGRRRFVEELCWERQGEVLVSMYGRILRPKTRDHA